MKRLSPALLLLIAIPTLFAATRSNVASDRRAAEAYHSPAASDDRKATEAYNISRQGGCRVYFSPNGGCTQAIATELNKARSTVLVQAYSFTSRPIAKALLEAHKRGVDVRVILDKSQRSERYSSADFLSNSGIPTRIDSAHAIAHNKVMIIDCATVIAGSFNFTKAAEERNAENLLVIHDNRLAARYASNWQAHCRHSAAYARGTAR